MDIRQAEFPALEFVGELGMVKAHEVEKRGMQIVNVNRIFDGVVAKLVALTQCDSASDPPASQPHGKGSGMMVSPQELGAFGSLAHGSPSEFPTPDHYGAI